MERGGEKERDERDIERKSDSELDSSGYAKNVKDREDILD